MSAFQVKFSHDGRESLALVFGPAALARYVDDEEKNWPADRDLKITSVLPERTEGNGQ